MRIYKRIEIDTRQEWFRLQTPGLYSEAERRALLKHLHLFEEGEFKECNKLSATWPDEWQQFIPGSIREILLAVSSDNNVYCVPKQQLFYVIPEPQLSVIIS